MNALAVGLVLLSAVIHALRNFLTKKAGDKQVFVWWYEVFALVFFLPLFVYFLFETGINAPFALYIGVAAGIVHFLYWVFLSKSYEKGDLSHVYPIMRSAPALVLVFSVVILKEQVSFLGALGILIVFLGAYIINMKKISLVELFEPVKSIARDRATQFAFLTLVSIAAYSLVDKFAVAFVQPMIYVYLINFFALAFFSPYVFYLKDRALIKREWVENKKAILLNGFFVIFGYSLILIAFTFEKLSYIVGLRQLSIVFAVLLGGQVLKEKHKAIRLTAALLIFLGAFLISIAQ